MEPELEECPFCEDGMLGIWRDSTEFMTWQAGCDNCGADGPYGDTKQEAADAWNTRPQESALRERVRVLALELEGVAQNEADWQARAKELEEALRELVGLVEAFREGEYEIDSFTCQPGRKALEGGGS